MNIRTWLQGLSSKGKAQPVPMSEELKSYFLTGVDMWKSVYGGGGDWRYARKGGLNGGYRRVKSLGAAKALCSELAALCFSQQMELKLTDPQAQSFVEQTLQQNNFWQCFPLFLEKVFALGSGVIKVYPEKGQVKLDYVQADAFIPTQYDEKGVYGGVAVSLCCDGSDRYLLAERHEKTSGGYRVTNSLYKKRGGGDFKEVPLSELFPDLQEQTDIDGLTKPLFVYFRPAVAGDDMLGVSVFSGAIDTLEALDTVFDSLEREFILGKKRIIVPTSALKGEYGPDGKLHKYFDTEDEVFQAFSADDKEELKIIDNSGELRVDEHIAALEQLLDLLCMQVGLSAGSLSYHSTTAKTATEVISRNDKTHRTKTAHQQLIREGLIDMVKNILLLGALEGAISPELAKLEPTVLFSDSVSRDNASKIDNALKLLDAGLIDKNRALGEIYGLTDGEAALQQEESED